MYFKPLNFLRFIAALLVVIFHFAVYSSVFPFDRHGFSWITTFIKQGNIFVSFFFVLSGFVQAYAYSVIPFINKKAYYSNRILKLYPTYLIALVLSYAVAPHLLSLKSLFFNVFLLTGWNWLEGVNVVNSPSWSLSAEFFFYALFPFLLHWLREKSIRTLALIWLGNIVLLWSIQHIWGTVYLAAYLALPIINLPLFIIGLIEGICFRRYGNDLFQWAGRNQVLVYITGISSLFLLFSVTIVFEFNAFINLWFYSLVFSGIIVSLCLLNKTSFLHKALSTNISLFLGDISYSIYILQIPVFHFASHFFSKNPDVNFYLSLLLLLFVSTLTYTYVENLLYQKYKQKNT